MRCQINRREANKILPCRINKNSRSNTTLIKDMPLKLASKVTIKCGEQAGRLDKSRINNSRGFCNDSDVLNGASGSSCITQDVNLTSPGLCSALILAEEIKAAQSKNVPYMKPNGLQTDLKRKALKKTNVPFSEHVFHSLVDLQINDAVGSTKTSTKSHEFIQNKDKVFHLEDYYKPCFSLEFRNKVPFQKREIEMVEHYDGFEIYDRLKSLPTCD